MMNCMICQGTFHNSPDQLILCEHKKDMVHMGCCTHKCSMDKKPCMHAKAMYQKSK